MAAAQGRPLADVVSVTEAPRQHGVPFRQKRCRWTSAEPLALCGA